jgi:hypothetical protein
MHSSRPCEKNDRLTCTALHWRRVSVGVEQDKATDAAFGFLTPEEWVSSVPFVVRQVFLYARRRIGDPYSVAFVLCR